MFQWVLQQLIPLPFILNRFRQLLGNTNHWQTGPGPRGGWAWWWSSPWSLSQGFSGEIWHTWADIIHDKQMPSVMQRMVLNKINNQSRIVEISSSLYILAKYFSSSTINFCCCYCDGCVHGSERHLTDAGASENPGLWAPAPGLSVPQQTRDNKNMANTEQLKSRGKIILKDFNLGRSISRQLQTVMKGLLWSCFLLKVCSWLRILNKTSRGNVYRDQILNSARR